MARHAPGLDTSYLEQMTPEETTVVRKRVEAMVKADRDEWIAHTKALMRASGARLI